MSINGIEAHDTMFIKPLIKSEEIEVKTEVTFDEETPVKVPDYEGIDKREIPSYPSPSFGLIKVKIENENSLYDHEDFPQETVSKNSFILHESFEKITGKSENEHETYSCSKCDHENMYRNINPSEAQILACDNCGNKRKHRQNFRSLQIKIFKCDQCDYKAKSKKQLHWHQVKHKDPGEVLMYKCDKCQHQTIYKNNLYIHQRVHLDPSNGHKFSCDQCAFSTNYKQHLTWHRMRHQDQPETQTYKCDRCQYETKHMGHLKRHGLVHSDTAAVPKYKCFDCVFETKYKTSLKRHVVTHHGKCKRYRPSHGKDSGSDKTIKS